MTDDGIFNIRIKEVRLYWMVQCTCEMDVFFVLFAQWNWWCIIVLTPQDSIIVDVNSAASLGVYRSQHEIESG